MKFDDLIKELEGAADFDALLGCNTKIVEFGVNLPVLIRKRHTNIMIEIDLCSSDKVICDKIIDYLSRNNKITIEFYGFNNAPERMTIKIKKWNVFDFCDDQSLIIIPDYYKSGKRYSGIDIQFINNRS